MIVVDATIVNVALPSIKDDLGFSQSSLAWVVNAYLIAFGGLLLLSGRLGDLIGQRRVFLIGLAVFTTASLLCGVSQSQGMLIGARFVQGVGGALTSAVILGMIVTMFPAPGRAGEGDWRLRLRRLRRGVDRAAGRRRGHRDDQLALDLLHQPPDRRSPPPTSPSGWSRIAAASASGAAPTSRRPAAHLGADARRLHDPRDHRARLDLRPHADPRRRLARPAGRLRAPAGADPQPADAPAAVPLAQRRRAPT